jgi:hypothetical protein
VPPDEACTSLDAAMIWAMVQNKKTFTKPLAVIHPVEHKGVLWEAQSDIGPQGLLLRSSSTVNQSPVSFKRSIKSLSEEPLSSFRKGIFA